MSKQILSGKKGIIFGALDENSIAWKVAKTSFAEGAQFVLSNAPIAIRKGDIYKLSEQCNYAKVIPADVTNLEEIESLFIQAMDILGGKIDFILHSVGMSPNVRKNIPYPELNYENFYKTIDISAISLHKILNIAWKLDAISAFGSIVSLSYIAAQRTFSTYNDMADAKALLESIVRSFGYHYGLKNKVRVNSISQSPTVTTAGGGVSGFNSFFKYAQCMSPLGNASGDDCADFCVALFSDYTRKITMQNLYHDGGFSNMGISDRLINNCFNCSGSCED